MRISFGWSAAGAAAGRVAAANARAAAKTPRDNTDIKASLWSGWVERPQSRSLRSALGLSYWPAVCTVNEKSFTLVQLTKEIMFPAIHWARELHSGRAQAAATRDSAAPLVYPESR